MSLTEIREADAPPGIAAIYAALRAASGVPQVNLIWRHAAALPGVLDWVWAQARPALESGAAMGARDRIGAAATLPAMARTAAPDAAAVLVETYNRGNLTNLAVLTAVRLRAEGVAAGVLGAPAPVGPALPEPPVLPRLDALRPEVAGAVRDLAARQGIPDAAVIPSLYLHLAVWPELLARLPAVLAPLFEGDALRNARAAVVAAAEAEAPALIAALGAAPPAPERLPDFLATLRLFTREVIPGMVPVGLCLRRAFATESMG